MLIISQAKSKVLNTVLNVDILMAFLSIFSWKEKELFSHGENMQVIRIINNFNMAQRATANLSPVEQKLFCRWCTKTNLCRLHFHSAHCDLFSNLYDQLSSCSSRIQRQSFCKMQQHKNKSPWQGVLHWLRFKCTLHTQFVLSASPLEVNAHTQRHTHTQSTLCAFIDLSSNLTFEDHGNRPGLQCFDSSGQQIYSFSLAWLVFAFFPFSLYLFKNLWVISASCMTWAPLKRAGIS